MYPLLDDLSNYLKQEKYEIKKKKKYFIVSQNNKEVFKSSNADDILLLFYFLFLQKTYKFYGVLKMDSNCIEIQEFKMKVTKKAQPNFKSQVTNLIKKAEETIIEVPAYQRKYNSFEEKGFLEVPFDLPFLNNTKEPVITDVLETLIDQENINYQNKVIIS